MYTVIGNSTVRKNNPNTGKTMTIHYVEAQDDTGNVVRVNVGFKPMPVGTTFPAVVEKYGELQVSNNGGPAPKSNAVTTTAPTKDYKRGVFPIPKDSGEFSIIRQSALKAAIDTLNSIVSPDLNTPEDVDAYVEDYVLPLAYKYADFSSGHREEKMVAQITKTQKV